MALYKNGNYLQRSADSAFDVISKPDAPTPYTGIYRCEGCNREIGSVYYHPLPPQNHHQHDPVQGTIRWRLIVATSHSSD
jgi:hypothetical protein